MYLEEDIKMSETKRIEYIEKGLKYFGMVIGFPFIMILLIIEGFSIPIIKIVERWMKE